MSYRRWFSPGSVCVHSLFNSLRAGSDDFANPHENRQNRNAVIAMGGTVLFVVLLLGAMAFAPRKQGAQPNYGAAVMIVVGLIGLAGAGAWLFGGFKNQVFEKRIRALADIARRGHGLHSAGYREIHGPSVGTVPWFHSEEQIRLFGLLCGQYQGNELAYVEGNQVIDPIARGSNSVFLQAAAGLGAGNKYKRLQLTAFDAAVFAQPLDLPDLVIASRMVPQCGYYKSDLADRSYELSQVPRKIRMTCWSATSDPSGCVGLPSRALAKLLESRRCILQILGGYCIVFTRFWSPVHPSQAPKAERTLVGDLDFATAVFEELKRFADGQPEVSVAERRASYKPRRKKRIGLILGGTPVLMLGALASAAFGWHLYQARNSMDWPSVEGRVIESTTEKRTRKRSKGEIVQRRPRVRYEYEVAGRRYTSQQVRFAVDEWTSEAAAMEVVKRYPEDGIVTVYHHPSLAHRATLERGLEEPSEYVRLLSGSVVILLIGVTMFGAGVRGRAPKALPADQPELDETATGLVTAKYASMSSDFGG